MGRVHVVKPGECLSSISDAYGFTSYKTIYQDGGNAKLRQDRPNPNVLFPGDEVQIPELPKPETKSLPTGKQHRIVVKRPKVKLRLLIQDADGKTAAGKRYHIKVGDLDKDGTIPSGGIIEEEVSPSEMTGTLLVYWMDDDDYVPTELTLAIGHLDPCDTPAGYQARLTNLGYRTGPFTGKPGRRTREALRAFQSDEGLKVTGEADDATLARLTEIHDKGG
jgi:N-acetylmuramoyl-L-alanine amidase